MSETKWTPGPWFRGGKPSGYNWGEIRAPRAEGATITVATINHWNPEVNDHNADLIAAAPELYDALEAAKLILWMAEKYAESGGSHGVEMSEFQPVKEKVDAALKKARNE